MTLVEQVRSIVSAEVDDFFEDSSIVNHLNSGYNDVVSIALSRERTQTNSLRALDSLRTEINITVTSKNPYGGFFVSTVAKPPLKEIQSVRVGTIPVKELTTNRLDNLLYNTATPSINEYYYRVKSSLIEIYSSNSQEENGVIEGISKPSQITTSMKDVPESSLEQLKDAILYMSAHRLIMQETVRENATTSFKQEALEQIELNMY